MHFQSSDAPYSNNNERPLDESPEIETTRTLYRQKNVYDLNSGETYSILQLPESSICNYGTVRGQIKGKENQIKIDLKLPESAFPKPIKQKKVKFVQP